MRLITVSEYLGGRAALDTLTFDQASEMHGLISAVNGLLLEFGEYRAVTSGYRTPEANKAAGGSKTSAHLSCQAVDLADNDGSLKDFCTEEMLDKFGLWMEYPDCTPGWCHLSTRPTKSGNRVFRP